jgi:HsdR family type I site-specific deoxyribonuclease
MFNSEKNFENALARHLKSLGWIEYISSEIDPDSYWCHRALQADPDKLKLAISRLSLSEQPLWKNASPMLKNARAAWATYKTIISKQRPSKAIKHGVVFPIESLLRDNFELGFVRQLRVKSSDGAKVSIPDLVLYAGGIPIGVLELKYGDTTLSETKNGEVIANTNLLEAESQLARYFEEGSSLWNSIQIVLAADQDFLLLGSRNSLLGRNLTLWSDIGEKTLELDIWHVKNFRNLILEGLVWDSTPRLLEKKNGSIYNQYLESFGSSIVARRHQLEVLEKVRNEVLSGRKDKGTIWHTPGSGKTFSIALCAAAFLKHNIMSEKKPIVYIVTDRIDLDDQIYSSLLKWKDLFPHRVKIESAKNRSHAQDEALSPHLNNPLIMSSTVAKLTELELTSITNPILVIVDEAHRSHNNQQEGYGRKIRENFPHHAKFLGLTGTPLERSDVSTTQIFGEIIHKFTLSDALKSNIVVDVDYTKKTRTLFIAEAELSKDDNPDSTNSIINQVQKSEEYLSQIALDIVTDWNFNKLKTQSRFVQLEHKPYPFFAMVACSSREEAYSLYSFLTEQTGYNTNNVKLVYSASDSYNSDSNFERYAIENKKYYSDWKAQLQSRYEDLLNSEPDSQIEIVVLVDMWLTGFDAPRAETIYLHKKLESANFIQTVSRVNRVEKYKERGRIVDFFDQEAKYRMALDEYVNTENRSSLNQTTRELIDKNLEESYARICELLGITKNDLINLEDTTANQIIIKNVFKKIANLHRQLNRLPQSGIFCSNKISCLICDAISPSSPFLKLVRKASGYQYSLNTLHKNLLALLLYLIKFDEINMRNSYSENRIDSYYKNLDASILDLSFFVSKGANYASLSSSNILNELRSTWTEIERETLIEDIRDKLSKISNTRTSDANYKDVISEEKTILLLRALKDFGMDAKFLETSSELEEIIKIISLIDEKIAELLGNIAKDYKKEKVKSGIDILYSIESTISQKLLEYNNEGQVPTLKIPSPADVIKQISNNKHNGQNSV